MVPPVRAEDAHAPEADSLVATNGACVRGGRVDDHAMVTAILDQVAHDRTDDLLAEPATLDCGREEEIHAGVAELCIRLLVRLRVADDLAVELDHPRAQLVALELRRQVLGVAGRPPARDLRRRVEFGDARHVLAPHPAEHDPVSRQGRRCHGFEPSRGAARRAENLALLGRTDGLAFVR